MHTLLYTSYISLTSVLHLAFVGAVAEGIYLARPNNQDFASDNFSLNKLNSVPLFIFFLSTTYAIIYQLFLSINVAMYHNNSIRILTGSSIL